MADWSVSEEAETLLKDAHLWDMTVPWMSRTGVDVQRLVLTRAAEYGYSLASLTISDDWVGLVPAITAISRERPYFLGNPDKFVLVDKFADVERAKQENKLAIVFHFQGTK